MKILSVVGARPNFMKIAPIHSAFKQSSQIDSVIVHTGQHYDEKMSDIFFNQLGLPKPHHYLGIGGGTHTWQKANVMLKFEEVLNDEKPDLVLVVGDVNATAACSIVATKMQIKVAHVEAGLRSGDRRMPEEVNRVITDAIADHLFVTEPSGLQNLAREGVPDEKVHYVGNVMIDSLVDFRQKAGKSTIMHEHNLTTGAYILMTMHRPHNVDNEGSLKDIIEIIENAAQHKQVVFAIHPRTEKNMKEYGLYDELENIDGLILVGPQGYLEFLNLMDHAALIITDSGGIQEETTYLQVPCMTFRDSTERPITVTMGTNYLMKDLDPTSVKKQMNKILDVEAKEGMIPPLWDGKAAERIREELLSMSNV